MEDNMSRAEKLLRKLDGEDIEIDFEPQSRFEEICMCLINGEQWPGTPMSIGEALLMNIPVGGGSSAEPVPGCYINGNLVNIENSSRRLTFDDPWSINELHLVFTDGNVLDAQVDENGYTDPPMECFYPPINRIAYHVVAEDDFEVFDYIYNGTMGAQEGTFFVSPNVFWIDGHEVDNSVSTFKVLDMTEEGLRMAVHFVFVDGSTAIDTEIAISSDEVVSIPASLKPFSASLGNAESVSRLIGELPEVH